MEIRPITIKDANSFVAKYHRHHQPVRIAKFALSAYNGSDIVGVAIVGRPLARKIDDGLTLEVRRLCTLGDKNVCSFLYSASARVAREMGYKKIITYILQEESGISLNASGWHEEKIQYRNNTSWDMPSRHREVMIRDLFGEIQKYPTTPKRRFCKLL